MLYLKQILSQRVDNPPANKHIWLHSHILSLFAIVSADTKSVFRLKPSAASNSSSNKFCANFKSFAHIVQQSVRTRNTRCLCVCKGLRYLRRPTAHISEHTHSGTHIFRHQCSPYRAPPPPHISHDIFFSNKIRMLVSHCPFFGLFEIYSSAQHYLYFDVSKSINMSVYTIKKCTQFHCMIFNAHGWDWRRAILVLATHKLQESRRNHFFPRKFMSMYMVLMGYRSWK